MSFRQRLTGFFVAIVILPMAIVGFVLFQLIEDNETGKADARLDAQQDVTFNLYRGARERAQTAATQIAADRQLATALQDDDATAAKTRAERLLVTRRARRIVVVRDGEAFVDVGSDTATAPATARLLGADRQPAGQLQVSVEDAPQLANDAASLMEGEVIIASGGRVLGSSVASATGEQGPADGEIELGGEPFRVASFAAPGFLGDRTRVATMSPSTATADEITRSRLLAAVLLGGFFILAFVFALVVSRSLQQQIAGVLSAARRLGGGDLAARVPAVGNDEFADLGREFNKMAEQLQSRLAELQRERERVQSSMRRLGQAVGSNLDAEALLQLVVETAVEGVDADAGRVIVRDAAGELHEAARVGEGAGLADTVRQAERRALQAGRPQTVAAPGSVALAHPLRVHESDAQTTEVTGVVSVGRQGRPFSLSETELFHYLAAQAAVSVENVGRHEAVARQSITDPLTRLANRRRFDEALASEVDRALRLGQPLGLVLLDLDDFKAVNDQYGHQQGDIVLREVARAVRRACRDIDIPARYGGEELAVILPGADIDGAHELAERIRQGVDSLRVPRLNAEGTLHVTASLGVAAVPTTAEDGAALITGADTALYQAKRAGKNRTARAHVAGVVPAE
ncbi:MAG: diguanylate cyclase [Solirubrobacteraceae bacterium]|nr:diguanylate cyclase [Solirubrobacteraceae bacterium]